MNAVQQYIPCTTCDLDKAFDNIYFAHAHLGNDKMIASYTVNNITIIAIMSFFYPTFGNPKFDVTYFKMLQATEQADTSHVLLRKWLVILEQGDMYA